MSNYPIVELQELVTIHDKRRMPITKNKRISGTYPYYGASGIADYISSYEFDGLYVLLAEDGDNLRTRNTPISFTANGKFWVNNHAHVLQGQDELDTRYICYALQYANIDSFISGSTRPKITQADLKKIQITAPKLSVRRSIAKFIYSLDQKIELNRQINETLEAMAQALFKSWFVDFDPVIDNALAAGNPIPDVFAERAKQRAAVKKPENQSTSATAVNDSSNYQHLFPAEFEFTEEMGWIPLGWSIGTLDNMLVLQRGFDLPKKDRTVGDYPLVVASGVDGTHNISKVAGPGVVTGRSGKLGIVNYIHDDFWPLNTTLWIKKYKNSSPEHAYFLLKDLELDRYNSGSAVPTLNRNHVHNLQLTTPSKSTIEAFSSFASDNFKKIHKNESYTELLTKLRDTLLPKLLSGELRIPDAEKLVQEALL